MLSLTRLRRRGFHNRLRNFLLYRDLKIAYECISKSNWNGGNDVTKLEEVVNTLITAKFQPFHEEYPTKEVSTLIKPSKTQGYGVFTNRPVRSGSILGVYPGLVTTLDAKAKVALEEDHDYFYFRLSDGLLFDPFRLDEKQQGKLPSPLEGGHALGLAHFVNHPPPNQSPNSVFVGVDFPKTPLWIPTRYQDTEIIGASVVLLATIDLDCGMEIFVDYNLNDGDASTPAWYAPVPKPGIPCESDWWNFMFSFSKS